MRCDGCVQEAVKSGFNQSRRGWLAALRDAYTPAQVLQSARDFIENVEEAWLEDWYAQVWRPWDKRPLPCGAEDPAEEEAAAAAAAAAAHDEEMGEEELEEEEVGEREVRAETRQTAERSEACEMGDEESEKGMDGGGQGEGETAGQHGRFEVGDLVECRAHGYQRWWEASIVKLLDDGKYQIKWASDPQTDLIKKASEVRKKKQKRSRAKDKDLPINEIFVPTRDDLALKALVRLSQKEEEAAISLPRLALVVYTFDQALHYERAAAPTLSAAHAAPTLSAADALIASPLLPLPPPALSASV
jgi:hypothetical protein